MSPVEELFAAWVEGHVLGEPPDPAGLCGNQPELLAELQGLIRRYQQLDRSLGFDTDGADPAGSPGTGTPDGPLPEFEGFRTIELLGRGGMGQVYKLHDNELNRTVAAKVIREGADLAPSLDAFLREASALALFQDPRVVQIHEFRAGATPPVIIMEHVDGFELGQLAPSLEYAQRGRVLAEICETVQTAHELGIQHRDLKPSNVMLDARLQPKILDFGLATADPNAGHGLGTLPYLAPEQLDPASPITDRTDVYALGVILYEALCAEPPFDGPSDDALLAAIREGQPRLPVELQPDVPEPLQAIALKAMERDPEDRFATAREMARELKRYLDGRPVQARPTLYGTALENRLAPHLGQLDQWRDLKLIYPHELARIRAAYDRLTSRDDDWIVESRQLSWSQITLYMGAFVLALGGGLFFIAHRLLEGGEGLVGPLLALGLPFAGLTGAAVALYRRQYRAVAVAFFLAGVTLLPPLLLTAMGHLGLFGATAETPGQFFPGELLSNRQLQIAVGITALWAGFLALRTRTAALSTGFVTCVVLLALALFTDWGLADWFAEGRWDLLSFHLAPMVPLFWGAGRWLELKGRTWATRPLYLWGLGLFVVALELLALDGRGLHYLGISLTGLQAGEVAHPQLLDTAAFMTVSGALFYATGQLLERHGTELMRQGAAWLMLITPFAILEPLAWLNATGDYAHVFDWLYLAAAVGITLLSRHRQRKAFYFAGLGNIGLSLLLISDHHEWLDAPWWASSIIVVGLLVLCTGLALDLRARLYGRR